MKKSKNKVGLEHLERQAYIYIRQSSLFQVQRNTGSTLRQYDLKKLALDLGWLEEEITIIDEDQGYSGSSSTNRLGFQKLVSDVSLGKVGAVIGIEVSRLARSSSDWHRLLELCSLSNCLVIDQEGIYNLKDINDRMILGVKGNLFEYELHFLKERLHGAKMRKAEQGKVRVKLPVGYIYNDLGEAILDPDEQVQESIKLAFRLFRELKSVGAVVKYMQEKGIEFPSRRYNNSRNNGVLVWGSAGPGKIRRMLDSPAYAGVYAYARRKSEKKLSSEEKPRLIKVVRNLAIEEWPIIKHDVYPSYINWEEYVDNNKGLDNNQTKRDKKRSGAAREGVSLLQGIVICGKCGRQMGVSYKESKRYVYGCYILDKHYKLKTCQSFRGGIIDEGISEALLEAITPAQLSISLKTLEKLEEDAKKVEQQWKLKLERAIYEADRSQRQYNQIEPENRLVARTLEKAWEEKLEEVESIKREYDNRGKPKILSLTAEGKNKILKLSQDLPRVWKAETTTNKERKQLLRLLIKDVTLVNEGKIYKLNILWQTGITTYMEVAKPIPGLLHRTEQSILELIKKLSQDNTDRKISEILQQKGLKTKKGKDFTPDRVTHLRRQYRITTLKSRPHKGMKEPRSDGRYCSVATAEILKTSPSQVVRWCLDGKLDAIRDTPQGPWWIKITPEIIKQYSYPFKKKFDKDSKGARSDGRYCTQAVTQMLNASSSAVIEWCNEKKLDAIQDFPYGPWWIKITPQVIQKFTRPSKQKIGNNGVRQDGRYSASSAAEMLNMTPDTVVKLCRKRKMDGVQDYPHGPWWIKLTPDAIEKFSHKTKTKAKIHEKEIREDGRCNSLVASKKLNLHPLTIIKWCRQGKLDAVQDYPRGSWWIKINPDTIVPAGDVAETGFLLGTNKKKPSKDETCSTSQAAIILGVNPVTVAKWCQEGKLNATQKNGRWQIRLDTLFYNRKKK